MSDIKLVVKGSSLAVDLAGARRIIESQMAIVDEMIVDANSDLPFGVALGMLATVSAALERIEAVETKLNETAVQMFPDLPTGEPGLDRFGKMLGLTVVAELADGAPAPA